MAARNSSKNAPARRGREFDHRRRAKVIEKIRDGLSQNVACRLACVDRGTVKQWLDSGRSDTPKHPEHVKFARDYDAAEAEGIEAAFAKIAALAKEDSRAAIALVQALDERFGDRALRRERIKIDNRRALLEVEKAEADVRSSKAKAEIAEAMAEKAKRNDAEAQVAFGLSMALADESMPLEIRQGLARWAISRGLVLIERADLTAEPAPLVDGA